ncbi:MULTISPECIES: sigma-54-dependent transcriptional regulator [Butyricimonas]|uniref:sigma-54-dependent transcriptional regulator n=1 Tax=Butyricimonas TaxID=574697 RepID=UPI000361F691|nr:MULTISPECIES: sigma-54 dependent transcriptional regulator [Butyricimonas]
MAKILVVDDDTTFCIMLKNWLGKRGFEVENAFSYKEAVKKLDKETFDLVLTDLRLPDKDGIDLLRLIKEKTPVTQVLLMTGYADIQTAVTAMKLGAFDYVAKPVIPDEILKKLQEALKLEVEPAAKPVPAKAKSTTFSYIKGVSESASQQYEYIHLVGPTMMTVLINGESGTGKEYIARLIHNTSARKDGPFVAVDCGAIPRDIATSELFGHVKGAFTGATTDKQGYFVTASGGTIFLDEIGNLPYDVQVQLLRALEERKVHPVGSSADVPFDVRIISATNENLKEAVADGRFREDLYHRLNEFSIYALPLRERKDDIMVFANHFLDKANEELGKQVAGFDDEVMRIFNTYAWPGNLRELRNIVKRATLLSQGKLISKMCLPPELSQKPVEQEKPMGTRREMEIELIKDALQKCRNNKSEAARMLQIDRKTLYNKLKSYGLEDL